MRDWYWPPPETVYGAAIRLRTEGIVAEDEDRPFFPDCTCEYDRLFEGEQSGWVYYRTVPARRCPQHGKPRWPRKGEK